MSGPSGAERKSARVLWQASRRAGELLGTSPHAAVLREALDIDAAAGPASVRTRLLRHTLAGFGQLRSRPLLLGLYLPRIPSIGPMAGHEEILQIDGGPEFLDSAARIAGAALSIAEHIRSRLPDYPELPVPDLCNGSPAVVEDGFMTADRFPWPAAARLAGAEAHRELRVGELGVDVPALSAAVYEVLAALENQEAWRSFAALAGELDDTARATLEHTREQFETRTTEEAVDRAAGDLLMQRSQYTRAVLAEVNASAEGRAGGYLAAFARVDRLITMALAVLSERAAYRAPVALPADTRISWHREEETLRVRAVASSEALFPFPGRLLVYMGAPPAGGALFLRGASHTIDPELGSSDEFDCEGLEDSAGVFDDLIRLG